MTMKLAFSCMALAGVFSGLLGTSTLAQTPPRRTFRSLEAAPAVAPEAPPRRTFRTIQQMDADRSIERDRTERTLEVSVPITWASFESYPEFIRRAEQSAKLAADIAFRTYGNVGSVVVIVQGDNAGAAIPVLSLRVSRQDWTRLPNPQAWATYFEAARPLMEENRPQIAAPEPNRNPEPTLQTGS
ncbi:hypothetical protein ACQ4M4_10665 [Leptolyngbya sp. AN02str]|uniref:hypothetical protein n=1 Tax=Leptolyngbya sp. AN02str TaxID=3423363 RepID=UPI003D31BC4F